jgi:O-antigen ligase
MNNNLIKTWDPRQLLIGVLVFLFPFLSLVTLFGVSLSSFTFFIAALFVLKPGAGAVRRHWREVRWVVLAFLLNFVFALLCLAFRTYEHMGIIEKPFRMLVALSALVLVLVFKPDRRALWWGVIAGAVAAALLVGYQRLELNLDRPGGLINPITFGDLSLLLGLLALAAAVDFRSASRALWPAAGAVAGIVGSIMTGTRGGWVALALVAFLFIKYSHALSSKRVRAVVVLSFALVAGSYFIPQTGVRERVDQGVKDITTYYSGGSAFSNLGIRLELWKGAALLIAEHPLLGQDNDSYKAAMRRYVAEGKLDPVVLPMPHLHNDALQAMVTGGVTGLLVWLATLVAPFLFFARSIATRARTGQLALALAGMLVVVAYFSFGLTEVIFWSVKGSLFYALMIFLLMGFCLNAKENDGK